GTVAADHRHPDRRPGAQKGERARAHEGDYSDRGKTSPSPPGGVGPASRAGPRRERSEASFLLRSRSRSSSRSRFFSRQSRNGKRESQQDKRDREKERDRDRIKTPRLRLASPT